ncbi:uracil-DNA glycosylase [Jiella marina]|uniref:uracil-DNA glycosylase n=1 Tax=Jiella sp. LLJ827 TaxID=2917712 RepID=UPI002100B141|nr:uracil-DNA glycosylase [Jiella sp. LLJ827]MCQ0987628.1 uracil-DNA glycosylase [Jiella sp. LLJ827]
MRNAGPHSREDVAAALLGWMRDSGLETFLTETPRNRFAETAAEREKRQAARRPAQAPAPSPRPASQAPSPSERRPEQEAAARSAEQSGFPTGRVSVPDDVAVADARERARAAASLGELREMLEAFDGCNLKVTAKTTVFGEGPETADLMLIGEAPGRDEDLAGVPFVGRSGQLLNRMLSAIGLERENVRVTNAVPWRPPGNRPPTPVETRICLPFIERQIELVAPKLLVCLGSPSAKAILGSQEGILRIRGKWTTYSFGLEESATIPAMAILHPAYLLRQPAQKRLAWRDLLALKTRLDTVS